MLRLIRSGLLVCLVLVGCATGNLPSVSNLSSVRSFSEATGAVVGSFDPLVDDMAASCRRRNELAYLTELDSPRYREAVAVCQGLSDNLGGIKAANLALGAYAKALGDLAQDRFVSYSPEMDGLGSALASLKGAGGQPAVSSTEVAAAGRLSEFLLRAATEGYRQREIGKVLEAHPDLEAVAGALVRVVERGYGGTLASESASLQDSLGQYADRFGRSEPLAVGLLRQEYRDQPAEIERKRRAVQSYKEALGKMVATHRALFEARGNLASADLAKLVYAYVKDLAPVVRQIQKAF